MEGQLRELWTPPSIETTRIDQFRRAVNETHGLALEGYHDLWQWSTDHINAFWMQVWSFTGVVARPAPTYAIAEVGSRLLTPRPVWFPETRLNFAENILRSAFAPRDASLPCVTGIREGASLVEDMTLPQLRDRVGSLSDALRKEGVKPGDRVACIGANSIDTFVIFLAAASVGAIFTSCSPETEVKGILDRFLQINARVLFADDAQQYNGKRVDCVDKILAVSLELRQHAALRKTVLVPRFVTAQGPTGAMPGTCTIGEFVQGASSELVFEPLRFDDPLLIVYSSGTTGQPKCLVHTVGGVLLKQKVEQILCSDMGPESVHMQYTTTNWIMYLYAVSGLLSGARSILYDGSPSTPSMLGFLEMLDRQAVTHLGTSAHYLNLLQQNGITKQNLPQFKSLKVITSTGSVLAEGQYDWVYRTFPPVQLSSIAGGTDIAGAFVGGAPNLPVHAGWCQARTLGMKVQIFSDQGDPIEMIGLPGELVCTAPFPSQPAFFWNDEGSRRYKAAYYEAFPGVWTQGDLIRMHPETGGIQFMGRSDGVLNPSGIRFGSAEVYNCLTVFDDIEDTLCVGQRRAGDTDEHVLLFVKMKAGRAFTSSMREDMKQRIRTQLSPRHVPAFICETPEIPMTVNGKKTEVPVKKIVSGQKITPSSTIVNPDSLRWFEDFARPSFDPQARGKSSKL